MKIAPGTPCKLVGDHAHVGKNCRVVRYVPPAPDRYLWMRDRKYHEFYQVEITGVDGPPFGATRDQLLPRWELETVK